MRPLSPQATLIAPSATPRCRTAIHLGRRNLMTQKHKRPTAPASKKLPKKAAKPATAAHGKDTHSKEKAAHLAAHSKDKGKHVEKHVEVKKPVAGKGKTPEKVAAP